MRHSDSIVRAACAVKAPGVVVDAHVDRAVAPH